MKPNTTAQSNALLTEAGAADMLGVSIRTLQSWRLTGDGPRYIKMGKSVRYRPVDLDVWVETKLTTSTSAQATQ